MLDVRKKLTSFLPSSTRSQLQNVLTVEWDTHKTVLVDVNGDQSRSNDVELSGIGSSSGGRAGGGSDVGNDRSEYGRLDDEDESDGLFNQSTFGSGNRTRSGSGFASTTLYGTQGSSASKSRFRSASASGSNAASMGRSSSSRVLPSSSRVIDAQYEYEADRPERYSSPARYNIRNEDDNPFDENSPTYKSSLAEADEAFRQAFSKPRSQYQQANGSNRRPKLDRLTGEEVYDARQYGLTHDHYAVGGNGSGNAAGGRDDPWSRGGWSETTSPTSSAGTRESARLEADNPFK